MSSTTQHEYWNVSYPMRSSNIEDPTLIGGRLAENEQDARLWASSLSRQHGHATVTNINGLVATYVNGQEWRGTE